jgi:hypothetical protein
MPQSRRGLRLALRAMCGLPLARDDLERHVEPVLLVAREPDGAGAAAAERPERAIAVEDELPAWKRMRGNGHDHPALAAARAIPAPRSGGWRPDQSLQWRTRSARLP